MYNSKDGGYQLEYSIGGKLLSQRYTLYLGAVLGQKNGSIWWNGVYDDNTKSFRIELTNNGKRVNFKHDLENDSSYEKIMDIDAKNLIVYYKKNGNSYHVIGLLKNQLDANNYNPIVSCYPGLLSPYKLFSPLNDVGVKLNCNAYWSLTQDIKVRIVHFDSKFAYHFNEIYQVVNKKLNEVIVTQPNHSLKPTEK